MSEPAAPRPVAGHVVREWLPRSQTFVHTLVANQRRYRPLVVAAHVSNRGEFPVDELVELIGSTAGPARRAVRRARARSRGWHSSWEHGIFRTGRGRQPAVLHAHFGPMGWRALGTRRRLGIPLVTTFYGFDLSLPEREPVWRERYGELFSSGDLFTVEGPAMAEHLAAIGCPADRIRIVRIGVKLERFPFAPRVPDGDLVFVQTGRFVPKKGIDISLRAFAQAGGPGRRWKLLLIGDGPERENLEALAARLGIAGSVSFLGMVSHAEYGAAIEQAHVALQPSRTAPDGDTEGGAPTVLLEMQAAGLPVLASRHADIPFVMARRDQLVAEGDPGALADAMVALSERPAEDWVARAQEARVFVAERHDGAAVAEQAEAVYDDACGSSAATAPSSSAVLDEALATTSGRSGAS